MENENNCGRNGNINNRKNLRKMAVAAYNSNTIPPLTNLEVQKRLAASVQFAPHYLKTSIGNAIKAATGGHYPKFSILDAEVRVYNRRVANGMTKEAAMATVKNYYAAKRNNYAFLIDKTTMPRIPQLERTDAQIASDINAVQKSFTGYDVKPDLLKNEVTYYRDRLFKEKMTHNQAVGLVKSWFEANNGNERYWAMLMTPDVVAQAQTQVQTALVPTVVAEETTEPEGLDPSWLPLPDAQVATAGMGGNKIFLMLAAAAAGAYMLLGGKDAKKPAPKAKTLSGTPAGKRKKSITKKQPVRAKASGRVQTISL